VLKESKRSLFNLKSYQGC